jgi:probable DNA metabolism protein
MICFVFDGTFEGLLTSIYEAYYNSDKPEEIIPNWQFEPTLLTEQVLIKTDEEKSNKVYNAIKNKISKEALRKVYYTFLSELDGACTLAYKYVRLGFKFGSEVDLYLHIDTVLNIHNITKKVSYECHRMLGFVRFKSVQSMYYSPIEPDHNILGLIASHFASRLPNENWIIHDIKRNLAVFYNKQEWILTSFSKEASKDFFINKEGDLYESLWKEFFRTIAIDDRVNSRLQKRMMPVRYWKNLTEFNE